MKHHFIHLLMCGFTLAWMLTACSSPVRVPPPEVVDTWQFPQDVEAVPPVSCEEIRQQFTYDAQAPLDIQEEKRYRDAGLTIIEFNYASPMGGRVPAILVVPDGKGPFAGMVFMHGSSGHRWQLLGGTLLHRR